MKNRLLAAFALSALALSAVAQSHLTREQILAMSTDELSELPLEDLMEAVETIGVSSVDELFALIMNKNVSSASKTEENSFTSPLSSTVITRDEMRTYGISTLEEAFRLIPGMIVSEKTNGVYDVQMRGLYNIPDNNLMLYTENANILVMVDGRITHNYALGQPFFEFLPIGIEDVDRIEVVRGATGALYGPNAVNGVVNIITEKPDAAAHTVQGSVQMGNDLITGDFGLRMPLGDKWAVGLTANFQCRQRPTDALPLFDADGVYVVLDESLLINGSYITSDALAQAIADGKILDASGGAYVSRDNLAKLFTVNGTDEETGAIALRNVNSANTSVYEQWQEPGVSRRNVGINGYVSFTPATDIRIGLNGGWQQALFATTPLGNEEVALRYREGKSGYLALDLRLRNLSILANYADGPIQFQQGTYGFDMDKARAFNAQAGYDLHFGDLSIHPEVSYQFVKYISPDPIYFDFGYGLEECVGYWGYGSRGEDSAELSNFSPSVRLDYSHNGFRAIAAYRADKTSIPDKWNHSWQLALSYLFNDNNFLRLSYGRSFRSASLVNSSSNYCWYRPQGSIPAKMQFLGNEDADLVHIDNIELGYRFRPTSRILIDAEAFYSRSTDYGELKSYNSMMTLNGVALQNIMGTVLGGLADGSISLSDEGENSVGTVLNSLFSESISSKSNIRYDEVPFVVNQMGVGVNVDWIASSKLIFKLNANVQRTIIDNYYQYSQAEMIARQIMASYGTVASTLQTLSSELLTSAYAAQMSGQTTAADYIADCINPIPYRKYMPIYEAMDEHEKEAFLATLQDAYARGELYDGSVPPLSLYYSLKYHVQKDVRTNEYYFDTNVAEPYTTDDGHKHKATPAFYGMLGCICKPTDQWTVSAFANLIGKRTYTTLYGEKSLDPRCTVNLKVGYKPVEQCEIFFNAHNLFNTDKREFVYTDKIGGIYTVGVNFGF